MDQASARGFYLSHTDLQLSQMNRYYRAKSNTLLSSFHENNTHLQLFIHAQVIGDHSVTTRSLLIDSGSWIFATRSVVPLAKKCISSSSFIFHKRKQTIKQTYKSGLLIGQEQAWLVVCHHAHCTKNTKISRIYDVALKVNQRPDQTSWTTCVHTFQCNNVID